MSGSWSRLHRALIIYDEQPFEEQLETLRQIYSLATTHNALRMTTSRSNTALHLACAQDRPELVGLLLSLGANTAAVNAEGETPLHHAVAHGCFDIIHQMLEAGCDVNAQDAAGCTPLHVSFERAVQVETVQELLKYGARLDLQDARGDSVLHYAAREGSVLAFEELLAAGADPYARNASGFQAFHTACLVGQVEIVRLFLAMPSREDWLAPTPNRGQTPLHLAARSSSSSLWDCLSRELPNQLAERDDLGRTPLDVAIGCANAHVAQGLDLEVKDKATTAPIPPVVINHDEEEGEGEEALADALFHIESKSLGSLDTVGP